MAPNFHDLEAEQGPKPEHMLTMMHCGKMKDFADSYDVVFLVINVKGYAQENNVRLRWSCNHSSELPWYLTEVPTVGTTQIILLMCRRYMHLSMRMAVHASASAQRSKRSAAEASLRARQAIPYSAANGIQGFNEGRNQELN